jgi:hypothetical protein
MKEKVPDELRKESIDDYTTGLLKGLKQWLWQKRARYREERRRAERAKAKVEAEAKAPKQLKLGV